MQPYPCAPDHLGALRLPGTGLSLSCGCRPGTIEKNPEPGFHSLGPLLQVFGSMIVCRAASYQQELKFIPTCETGSSKLAE